MDIHERLVDEFKKHAPFRLIPETQIKPEQAKPSLQYNIQDQLASMAKILLREIYEFDGELEIVGVPPKKGDVLSFTLIRDKNDPQKFETCMTAFLLDINTFKTNFTEEYDAEVCPIAFSQFENGAITMDFYAPAMGSAMMEIYKGYKGEYPDGAMQHHVNAINTLMERLSGTNGDYLPAHKLH